MENQVNLTQLMKLKTAFDVSYWSEHWLTWEGRIDAYLVLSGTTRSWELVRILLLVGLARMN
jgi:hypothetical protein